MTEEQRDVTRLMVCCDVFGIQTAAGKCRFLDVNLGDRNAMVAGKNIKSNFLATIRKLLV